MQIEYAKRFIKQLEKSPQKIQVAFRKRIEIFTKDMFSSILNNHRLTGRYKGLKSINVTGNWRAIYEEYGKGIVYFTELGTHSQLYQ